MGRHKKKIGWKAQILLIFGLLMGAVFLQTSIVVCVGMLPTIVAALADRTGKGTLAVTVGAANLAGCSPFLIELWSNGHTLDLAIALVTDPRTVVIIYSAAAMGYFINWSVASVVEILMVKQSQSRLSDIQQEKGALIQRLGEEVTGEIPLDDYGFPLGPPEEPVEQAKTPKIKEKIS
jgi:hypothetical protein